MNKQDRIFVAGHAGLVGSAVVRELRRQGYENLTLRRRAELDLTHEADVASFLAEEKPDIVIDAAAKVGGIFANQSHPADFIRENLLIQSNLIHHSFASGVKKFVFLGSSCIYPRDARQPIREEALLTGPLETTNEAYAVAKIAGIQMCQAYRRQFGFDAICLMPTNLFGPGDNFDLETSHVLPALLRKCHDAKHAGRPSVSVWGSGRPLREFLYVDDLASAIVFLAESYSDARIINVGTGSDISIADLADMIARVVGFTGDFEFDASKPDGTPRKLLDISRLRAAGWEARRDLEEGIRLTYEWFLNVDRAAD